MENFVLLNEKYLILVSSSSSISRKQSKQTNDGQTTDSAHSLTTANDCILVLTKMFEPNYFEDHKISHFRIGVSDLPLTDTDKQNIIKEQKIPQNFLSFVYLKLLRAIRQSKNVQSLIVERLEKQLKRMFIEIIVRADKLEAKVASTYKKV